MVLKAPKSAETNVMTAREAAAYLRVHLTTLYRVAKQGNIPAFRVGNEWRFRKADIDGWVAEQDKGGRTPLTTSSRRASRAPRS